jgi:hypothetical protein
VGLLRPAQRWLEIDICLDRGGRWDYAADLCELAAGDASPRAGAAAEKQDTAHANCASLAPARARAECLAVDTVEKVSGLPARIREVVVSEGGYCIITSPGAPVLDGAGVVEVDTSGVVRGMALTDSAACPVAAEPRAAAGVRPRM